MYLQNEGVLRHETLQLFLFLFPLRHMKRPALQNKQAGVLRMAFRARKDFGTFEKRAPGARTVLLVTEYRDVFFQISFYASMYGELCCHGLLSQGGVH